MPSRDRQRLWKGLLFLNGRRLLRRGFVLRDVTEQSSGIAVTVRYRPGCAEETDHGGTHHGNSFGESSLAFLGCADGGSQQPLAAPYLGSPEARPEFGEDSVPSEKRFWVGDGDSSHGVPPGWTSTVLDPHKSISDGAALMELALSESQAVSQGAPLVVEIIGALGGRRDHEWANLAEIAQVFGNRPRVLVLVQPSLVLFGPAVSVIVEGYPSAQPLSCFASKPSLDLRLLGLKYSGAPVMERPSLGLSNHPLANASQAQPFHIQAGVAPDWKSPGAWGQIILGHDEECYFS